MDKSADEEREPMQTVAGNAGCLFPDIGNHDRAEETVLLRSWLAASGHVAAEVFFSPKLDLCHKLPRPEGLRAA